MALEDFLPDDFEERFPADCWLFSACSFVDFFLMRGNGKGNCPLVEADADVDVGAEADADI